MDAPLDETNVGRFAKLIADMSATTQFVVITHSTADDVAGGRDLRRDDAGAGRIEDRLSGIGQRQPDRGPAGGRIGSRGRGQPLPGFFVVGYKSFGEKSVIRIKVESTFSTIGPLASLSVFTLIHSGSSWKAFQLLVAASRLGELQDVDESAILQRLVGGGPVGDVRHAVLRKKARGVVAEARQQSRQATLNGVIDPQFEDGLWMLLPLHSIRRLPSSSVPAPIAFSTVRRSRLIPRILTRTSEKKHHVFFVDVFVPCPQRSRLDAVTDKAE